MDVMGEIYKVIRMLYFGVVKIDLNTDEVTVLHSIDVDDIAQKHQWSEYLAQYAGKFLVQAAHKRLLNHFTAEKLKESAALGKFSFSVDFLPADALNEGRHITMRAFMPEQEKNTAYILVKNADDDYFLKSIVNQYLYNNCDYFIYLDAKHNSYAMFSGYNDSALLPESCEDYETALTNYASAHVVDEDRDEFIREIHLSRVLEQLDRYGRHSFSYGVVEPGKGYARKHMTYSYHDRENQMILFSRTDITDVYMETQSKQKDLEEALFRAQTDTLTGLWNFQSTADKVTECLTVPGFRYGLLFIDLDDFKKINDTFGHGEGDRVLKQVACVLTANTGDYAMASRVGGDEFVVFAEIKQSVDEIKELAEKLCREVSSITVGEKGEEHISCSIGIAIAPDEGNDYYELIKKADSGLYRAKSDGKNCWHR